MVIILSTYKRTSFLIVGIAMTLVAQDMFDSPLLNRVILSNTSVRITGKNSASIKERMSREMGIPAREMANLKKYQFRIQAGDKEPVLVKPRNVL